MAFYHYKSLQFPKNIRLIGLAPGISEESLSARIFEVSISDAPVYSALSYAWQKDDKTAVLCTEDGGIPITQSLDSALRQIRESDVEVVVWVDAVCINQADDKEKSHQVRQMRNIYEDALDVKVHLDADSGDYGLCVELIRKLAVDLERAYGIGADDIIQPRDFERFGLPARSDPAWEALRALLRRPWFRRVWIVQEFVVAKIVWFIFGGGCLPSEVLAAAILQCDRHTIQITYGEGYDRVLMDRTESGRTALLQLNIWSIKIKENPPPLLELLVLFRYTLATHARDHFFALLGLAGDAGGSEFDPDYEEPFESVVMRYAGEFVRRGQGMDMLGWAGLGTQPDRFPSWIPDFTSKNLAMTPLNQSSASHRKLYHASGTSKPQMMLTDDPGILAISGVLVDVISHVGKSHYEVFRLERRSDLEPLLVRLEEADSMIASLCSYPTGEHVIDAYWRTLIRNKTIEFEEPPPSFGPLYHRARSFIKRKHNGSCTEADVHDLPSLMPFLKALIGPFEKTRFCVTDKGYIGLCNENTEPGDCVAILLGGLAPVIIRKTDARKGYFRLVGECYVHGMMTGEQLSFPNVVEAELFLW